MQKENRISKLFTCRGVVRTGATGAIAPVDFEKGLIAPVDFEDKVCAFAFWSVIQKVLMLQ